MKLLDENKVYCIFYIQNSLSKIYALTKNNNYNKRRTNEQTNRKPYLDITEWIR